METAASVLFPDVATPMADSGAEHDLLSARIKLLVQLVASPLAVFGPAAQHAIWKSTQTEGATNDALLVYGQSGDDNLQVSGSVSLAAWLFGGDGDDRLKGGSGSNVLAGGIGDDLLIGGSGRDFLEGGWGADRLVGNGGEDILIGGYLAFAHYEAALGAIMAEWNSNRSYNERVANLRGDDSSPSFDQRANGEVFLSVSGSSPTVRDDGDVDRVTGSAGRDWFFANLDEDLLTDLKIEEQLAELFPEL